MEELLTYYGLDYKTDEVKDWYNGYVFGDNTVIYNPWSIINYAKYRHYQPYWVNTSSNDLIVDILKKTDAGIKQKLALLIEGKELENVNVNTSINFRNIMDMQMLDEEVLWNFLIVSGYLKTVDAKYDEEGDRVCKLKIPNKEILKLYKNIIVEWFRPDEVSSSMIKPMLEYLVNGRIEEFEKDFKYLVRKTFGTFDVGRNAAENFYHAFVLDMLVNLEGKYRVMSNKESGDGRPDVIIIPKDVSKKGVVIEFKVTDKNDEAALQDSVKEALGQIDRKNYADELRYAGIKEVIKIGIAFCGKEVYLGYNGASAL